jgi:hypothetical protein
VSAGDRTGVLHPMKCNVQWNKNSHEVCTESAMHLRVVYLAVVLVLLLIVVVWYTFVAQNQAEIFLTDTLDPHYSEMLTSTFGTDYAMQTLTPAP